MLKLSRVDQICACETVVGTAGHDIENRDRLRDTEMAVDTQLSNNGQDSIVNKKSDSDDSENSTPARKRWAGNGYNAKQGIVSTTYQTSKQTTYKLSMQKNEPPIVERLDSSSCPTSPLSSSSWYSSSYFSSSYSSSSGCVALPCV